MGEGWQNLVRGIGLQNWEGGKKFWGVGWQHFLGMGWQKTLVAWMEIFYGVVGGRVSKNNQHSGVANIQT